jgi:hypothetical protein
LAEDHWRNRSRRDLRQQPLGGRECLVAAGSQRHTAKLGLDKLTADQRRPLEASNQRLALALLDE